MKNPEDGPSAVPNVPCHLIVIDTETTGAEETDQVVEIAMMTFNTRQTWDSLIRPTVPVNVIARAVHHIQDHELEKAPLIADIQFPWQENPEDYILVGHSVDFDIKMLQQSGIKNLPSRFICTWRCARHLFPDAPRHSNQVLRYYLNLPAPPVSTHPPHRALADVLVTSALLHVMLEQKTIAELLELSVTPVLLQTCTFGAKWRGKPWQEVDEGYLRWLLSCKDPPLQEDVQYTARYWLDVKIAEREERIRKRKAEKEERERLAREQYARQQAE
jgi:exodeoxyribonuclease X